MSTDEEYRRQAALAEKQALAAKLDSDREAWLRIAQGWMSLLRKRPQSDEQAFNAQTTAEGTGRKILISRIRPHPSPFLMLCQFGYRLWATMSRASSRATRPKSARAFRRTLANLRR
jgi:hypothetical protein